MSEQDGGGAGAGRRALVVDDNTVFIRLFILTLKRLGFVCDAAHDVESAIRKLDEQKYDLLLTDLNLGKSPGWEIMAHARVTRPEMKIIGTTAWPCYECADHYLIDGGAYRLEKRLVDGMVQKSPRFAVLQTWVEELFQ